MIILQRIESAAILALLLMAYHATGLSLVWLLVFILAPDISMLGYLKDPKIGAVIYNIGHSYIIPVILLIVSFHLQSSVWMAISLIWALHIAIDRALGFGLKLPTGFRDTHLRKL